MLNKTPFTCVLLDLVKRFWYWHMKVPVNLKSFTMGKQIAFLLIFVFIEIFFESMLDIFNNSLLNIPLRIISESLFCYSRSCFWYRVSRYLNFHQNNFLYRHI